MEKYNQKEKIIARRELISHAINVLIENKHEKNLVTKDTFSRIVKRFTEFFEIYLIKKEHIEYNFDELILDIENTWFKLYDSIVKSKQASDLKVLYLSGPEPTNDLDIFLEYGILPYNIWAIENDKNCFNSAVENLIINGNYIKLHKGSLKDFFSLVNESFDVVYFDACTPIISNNNNPLLVLKEVFLNRRLNSSSVLITNFAEPNSDLEDWSKIFASWFAPRYEECPSSTHESDFSDISSRYYGGDSEYQGNDILGGYSKFIKNRIPEYYDEFIPSFVSILAAELVPFWNIVSLKSVSNRYFWDETKLNELLKKIRKKDVEVTSPEEFLCSVPHFMITPEAYPLISWAMYSLNILKNDHPLNRFLMDGYEGKTLNDAIYVCSILKAYDQGFEGELETGINTFTREICSDQLNNILKSVNFFDYNIPITCDVPMKNLLVELIIGLYGFPYISNSEEHKSLKYKAKETWMYSDVFLFDQCRYLYDFIPTLDLFKSYIEQPKNQIIVRACIDNIKRKHFQFNYSFFQYGFIDTIYADGFKVKKLNKRVNINEMNK